ncbi:MAG: D-Ala-D-Ala carboxypeptidase family metallohydrolase [Bacteroidales bacterium]|jgi:hypothetical protein|nr:D-Ala-D-Ala carboxypeptidase family metallohydrolase [Bacteroidales bacterium]MDD3331486.1 D-Ala-D-Ala carboxypeptidase family metallohydrolase [Bacteroidales bacterium]
MRLSENFTVEEATRSNKAISLNIDNSLSTEKLLNAEYFAKNILQPLRSKIGIPFIISSWYRCPALNKAVGGVSTSAHLSAMAIDFKLYGKTSKQTYDIILKAINFFNIDYDQLIEERNTKTNSTWVHLGVKKLGNRNQHFKLEV